MQLFRTIWNTQLAQVIASIGGNHLTTLYFFCTGVLEGLLVKGLDDKHCIDEEATDDTPRRIFKMIDFIDTPVRIAALCVLDTQHQHVPLHAPGFSGWFGAVRIPGGRGMYARQANIPTTFCSIVRSFK